MTRKITGTLSRIITMFALIFGFSVAACTQKPVQQDSTQKIVGMIAPNGVRCTGFMGAHPGYSCYEQIAGKPGVRCSGYIPPPPFKPVPSPPPPVIYSVNEIGQPGVPKLTRDQNRTLQKIENRVGRKHLRFLFLGGFIVFNATRGDCADWAGGYDVLNDNPDHRIFYEPGENPYSTLAAPGA